MNRFARVISFGSLAAGLSMGAIAEATRRGLGLNNSDNKSKPIFIYSRDVWFDSVQWDETSSVKPKVKQE